MGLFLVCIAGKYVQQALLLFFFNVIYGEPQNRYPDGDYGNCAIHVVGYVFCDSCGAGM